MAYKTLTIDARLNTKVLQSQYSKVSSEIETLKRKLTETDRPDIAEELAANLQNAKAELKDTEDYMDSLAAKQARLKAAQQQDPFAFASSGGADRLAGTTARMEEARKAADGYRDEIDKATAAIDKHNKDVDAINWKMKALQGYADQYGEALKTAEAESKQAAAETEKAAAATGKIAKNTKRAGRHAHYFGTRMREIVTGALFFNLISRGFLLLTGYIGRAFRANEQLAQSFANLKAAAATAVQPIINTLAPAVQWLSNLFSKLFTTIARVFALLTGKSVQASYDQAAALNATSKAGKAAAAAIKKKNKAEEEGGLLDFDQLNTLSTAKEEPELDMGGAGAGTGEIGFGEINEQAVESSETFQLLERALVAIGRIIRVVAKAFQAFYQNGLKPILEAFGITGETALEAFVQGLEHLADWMEDHQEEINQFVTVLGLIALPLLIAVGAMKLFGSTGSKVGLLLATVFRSPLGIFGAIALAIGTMIVMTGHGGEAIEALQGIFGNVIQGIVDMANGDIDGASEHFKAAMDYFVVLVEIAAESILQFIAEYGPEIGAFLLKLVGVIAASIGLAIIKQLGEGLKSVWEFFQSIGEFIGSIGDLIITSIYNIFNDAIDSVFDFGTAVSGFVCSVVDFIILTLWNLLTAIVTWLVETGGKIWDWMGEKKDQFVEWITGIGQSIKDGFAAAIDWVAGKWKDFWAGVRSGAAGAINGVLSGVEGFVNGAIDGINAVINALNSIHINIPDWVPLFGGKSFGIHLPTFGGISLPRVPAYANGAVLPGGHPHLAWLGDQPRNQTNVEAPAELIKQMVREALGEYQPVVRNNIILRMDGSLASLARILKPALDTESRRRGDTVTAG